MGEIGCDRRDYLFDMDYTDIALIIRGYHRRGILQLQLQRLQAYGSFFCMSGSKNQKSPSEWLPLYFDRYEAAKPPISEDECAELLDEIRAMNAEK